MKKIKKSFYLAAILLAFISCTTKYTTTYTDMQVDRIDNISIDRFCTISVYNIEYNGHEYLIFDGYESMGVEHNPDCKKCKSRSSYTPAEYLY